MNVLVKRSPIHGKGVFAATNFKKGEMVIKYNLKPLTDAEYASLPESEKHFTTHKEGKYWLFSSPERFVNHSCEPNTHPINNADVAIRDIRKGEEITTDYRLDDVPDLSMNCTCGSKVCKKVITND